MGTALGAGVAGFAGRSAERALVAATLEAAAAGTPGVLVVLGEAGIGKTRLVAEACSEAAAAGSQVLWGRCLHLDTWSMPYLPLVGALEGWLDEASDEERDGLAAAAPALAGAVPSLTAAAQGPHAPGGLPAAMVRALDHLASLRPTVLVVDDLHWVDSASLDVLAYAVAGLRTQPIGIVLTVRDEQLGEGNRLHGWLADVRRIPLVHVLHLQPLTVEETAEQLGLILGSVPDADLVATVQLLSGGNPYFTELLAHDVDPATGRLPDEVPAALRGALLASWHRLDKNAREVLRLLAVAGRPVTGDVLAAAAATIHLTADEVAAAVRAAGDAGVVVLHGTDVWFRHPLLAEVLLATLLPFERVAAHDALLEALTTSGRPARLADLARHYEGAHRTEEALDSTLAAAAAAARVEAYDEEADLRLRAVRLWPRISPPSRTRLGSEARLCADAAASLLRAGRAGHAFAVLELARTGLTEEPDPLQRSRVLRLWAKLASGSGQPTDRLGAVLEQALDLCAGQLDSAERSMVLDELSYVDVCEGRLAQARARAEQAVQIGRTSGDQEALCVALHARAWCDAGSSTAASDLDEADRIAARSGSVHLQVIGLKGRASMLEDQGRIAETVDAVLAGHELASRHGLAHLAQVCGAAGVISLLHLGRMEEARTVLGRVLTGRTGGAGGLEARDAALRLAVRSGDTDEADRHAERLAELAPDGEALVGTYVLATRAEYLLFRQRADDALSALQRHAAVHGRAFPMFGHELLVWLARAAVAVAVDDPSRRAHVRAVLDQVARDMAGGEGRVCVNPVDDAWQALVDAETARLDGSGRLPVLLRAAVERTAAAGLRVEELRARLELAHVLAGQRQDRRAGARELRTVHARAVEMGLQGLVEEAESLALAARISLRRPDLVGQGPDPPTDLVAAPLTGLLTRREREVLGHLVAGRTYAEIARDLVISEKTVSVHVSNLLRKTGAANRVEAAAWAERHGMTASPPPG